MIEKILHGYHSAMRLVLQLKVRSSVQAHILKSNLTYRIEHRISIQFISVSRITDSQAKSSNDQLVKALHAVLEDESFKFSQRLQ